MPEPTSGRYARVVLEFSKSGGRAGALHAVAMTPYLLVETRCAWESGDVDGLIALAAQFGAAGHSVDLFLIQNGVLMAADDSPSLAPLAALPSVTVWADGLALAARAIPAERVSTRVCVADFTALVGLMTRPGAKTIWH